MLKSRRSALSIVFQVEKSPKTKLKVERLAQGATCVFIFADTDLRLGVSRLAERGFVDFGLEPGKV
jgi:hypothetical protein